MLPAIISTMRKEVGSGVTIAIEDKNGTIRNTFKESVQLDEESSYGWVDRDWETYLFFWWFLA